MTSYNSQLIAWGDAGQVWPAGYSYQDDVPPVDAYDNFGMSNLIDDVIHLVDLTNARLDSSRGTTRPGSPTDGQLFWNTGASPAVLEVYDTTYGGWKQVGVKSELDGHVADTSNPHSVTFSQVGAIEDAAGTVNESHLSFSIATQAELDSHTTDTTNPHSVTAAQVGSYTTAQADSNFAAAGHTHDSRYYTQSAVDNKRGKLKHFASVTDAENDGTVAVGDMVYITGDSKVYVKTA